MYLSFVKLFKNISILAAIGCIFYTIIKACLRGWPSFDKAFLFFFLALVLSLGIIIITFIEINNPTFRTSIYSLSKTTKAVLIALSSILVLLLVFLMTGFVTDLFSGKWDLAVYCLVYFMIVDLSCNVRFIYILTETDLAEKRTFRIN
jgi:hypothetical protein